MRYINLIILLIFFSCNQKKSIGVDFFSKGDIDLYKHKTKTKGDKKSYDVLSTYYFQNTELDSLLPYAKIMCLNYNYNQACFDVYFSLLNFKEDLNYLNEIQKQEALNFLIKANERGHEQANDVLEEYISKNIYVEKSVNTYIIKKDSDTD